MRHSRTLFHFTTMAFLLAAAAISLGGCGQKTSKRGTALASVDESQITPEFKAARAILLSRCVSCHDGQHDRWNGYYEQDFINDGVVVAGNATNSTIFSRLKNSRVGGLSDMPNDGTTLSDAQISTIRTWIQSIK